MPLGTEVGLGQDDIFLDGDPAPLPKNGAEPPQIFGPCVMWPNGWMDQDGTWHGSGPWSRPHCARWAPSSPPQKRAEPPIFGPFLLWSNGWMDQDASWHGGRPWPRRHCVRWGPSSPFSKDGAEPPPKFSAHVYCGHTAGWIKIPLATEVGLSLGNIVLHGDPSSPPPKGHVAPQFLANVRCGQTAGWIKMPLGTEVNLGPGEVVLDGVAAPTKRRTAPSFRFVSIVAKRLDG